MPTGNMVVDNFDREEREKKEKEIQDYIDSYPDEDYDREEGFNENFNY